MEVEIWSDVVCPWCYIGKRRFESALALFDHAEEVRITWRSFELDPNASKASEVPLVDLIAKKYGLTVQAVQESNRRITDLAAVEGLHYRLDLAQSANSFDAHRMIHLASETGLADAAEERLFRSYFSEGGRISDRRELTDIAVEIGLDRSAVREVLVGDAYVSEVRADEALAMDLGISGVPFFAIDRRYGISGAQDVDTMLRALNSVWQSSPVD
ncbi:MAG: DsbA family oxidoreductase [Acidimicrobiaceae bacterium]|nr:DsbA family oxidoreductase [Acidimicrobiaceae bacterium]